ncbi:hypothetical protein PISMIDRAFT_672002 [Pisolithus microcarpus 441]|uniref:Unplaced genomic scaffold scaffold_4, whole genome shotgun sequence n=1 Tax=Pisolithus microcarpus 441 TaxID=765257 RepID=A0A0D0A6I3_9AGAM|nr:hypothetical protein PISMIDRAFT_672002 [Pisolithus microcarpus 441]
MGVVVNHARGDGNMQDPDVLTSRSRQLVDVHSQLTLGGWPLSNSDWRQYRLP